MSKLDFTGRVALVTGAGRGLGAAYAEALAVQGASVVVNDIGVSRNGLARAEKLATRLSEMGLAVVADTRSVADEAGVAAMVDDTVARFGAIDILINNAGIGDLAPVHEADTQRMRAVFDTHVFGSAWTMRAAIPHMRARKFGRIVNTISAAGAFGMPNFSAYSAAKGALIAITRCVSQEHLDIDLRANAIAPVAGTVMAGGFFALNPMLDESLYAIDAIVPLVTFLSHRTCMLNGELLTAGAGRYARIWTSTAAGLFRPGIEDGDFEVVLPELMSRDGEIEPWNALDEFILATS